MAGREPRRPEHNAAGLRYGERLQEGPDAEQIMEPRHGCGEVFKIGGAGEHADTQHVGQGVAERVHARGRLHSGSESGASAA